MAGLQESLKSLSPIDWNDVPHDDLSRFLAECFEAGELLCNSVPPPPNGTPFDSSLPHGSEANSASSAKELLVSSARPAPRYKEHEDLQESWGKPMKFGQKENPLGVALYKMAGHDRHGAWFARQSIHEGIGFSKFKQAMQREFPETMLTQGPPGAGAKRGLSAERRVERIDVKGDGRMEVYLLSAQMPSPVSPRDFLTLLLTTDHALTEKSAAEVQDGKKHVPRHYMVISKSLDGHPDAPTRSNFVRGQYESVEMIREIPLHAAKSKSTPNLLSTASEPDKVGRERGATIGFAESRGPEAKGENVDVPSTTDDIPDDPELNPVEWVMITRSDPGGGIPRFLIDRGTPGAMLGDVTKFLNWATGQKHIPDPDADEDQQQQRSDENAGVMKDQAEASMEPEKGGAAADVTVKAEDPNADANEGSEGQLGGLISSVTGSLEAGIAAHAPTSVSNYVHDQLHPGETGTRRLSVSSSDSSSVDSFLSAEELKRLSTAAEYLQQQGSAEDVSIGSAASSSDISKMEKKNLSQLDKEIVKIMQQREKLEQKLIKKRQMEEDKLRQTEEKEMSEQQKARSRMEKEMKKTEDRHRKEIEKLDVKRDKETKKAEDKRRKKEEQNKLSLVARERDDLRSQADLLRKENELLRGQVESLQKENTALATRLGKAAGPDAVKSVQDEFQLRNRSGTAKSGGSRTSVESAVNSEEKE